jgi:hypothetical protein
MSASARLHAIRKVVFGPRSALAVASVIAVSAIGAYMSTAAATSAAPVELNVVPIATAPPSTAAPTLAPTQKPVAPKVVAAPRVAAKTVTRAAPAVRPAPVYRPAAPVAGGTQMKTALLIGVGHPVGAQALEGAIPDAENTRKALIADGFPSSNIQMLIDGQATRNAILAGLRSLAARTSPNGKAVFLVATHSSQTSFRTYEGNRIQRSEVASLLGQVRGKLWSTFAVCYAGAYSVPGITGPNRIAVFGSSSTEETWENSAGSDLVRYMIGEAMLEGKANSSVEAAYNYGAGKMYEDQLGHPSMNDQIAGPFSLK